MLNYFMISVYLRLTHNLCDNKARERYCPQSHVVILATTRPCNPTGSIPIATNNLF